VKENDNLQVVHPKY